MLRVSKVSVLLSLLLCVCAGAIQIDDPLSGTLPSGPQQPAGSVAVGTYVQDDHISVNYTNYGPGFYNSGTVQADEYWKTDWTDNNWGASYSVNFQSSPYGGYWTVSAFQWDSANNVKSAANVGGAMIAD